MSIRDNAINKELIKSIYRQDKQQAAKLIYMKLLIVLLTLNIVHGCFAMQSSDKKTPLALHLLHKLTLEETNQLDELIIEILKHPTITSTLLPKTHKYAHARNEQIVLLSKKFRELNMLLYYEFSNPYRKTSLEQTWHTSKSWRFNK